jgi:diguanylate cyclase (GGDEF)-like protein
MISESKWHDLQGFFLRRFGIAAATYGLVLGLAWLSMALGLYRSSMSVLVISSLLVIVSQLAFFMLFRLGLNLRFDDPSLTQAQVLLASAWHTFFVFQLMAGRGTLLVFYLVILLFGIFQLSPLRFAGCALFAFVCFAGMSGFEVYLAGGFVSPVMVLQLCVLLLLFCWMSLMANYVQKVRERMRQRRYALQAHQDTLRGMMRQLESLASTDELTGLYNRRHFLRLADRELSNLPAGRQHGLALIDLDHFKRINDQHGHAVGDRVLQSFASMARASLRDRDVLARYGGEEFVLLLPNSDAEQVRLCCERLRDGFSRIVLADAEVSGLSLSIGMTLLQPGEELDDALHRSDQALYQAKRSGRDRCQANWTRVDAAT